MNIKQKIILRIGAAVAAAFLLFPNFVYEYGDGGSQIGLGHSFIFTPAFFNESGSRVGYVDSLSLLVEVLSVAVICAALWWSEKE
jgi:hypothetical protein